MIDHYIQQSSKVCSGIVEGLYRKINDGRCESPIEEGFLIGLIYWWSFDRSFKFGTGMDADGDSRFDANILLQHKVGVYRIDFAVHLTADDHGRKLSHWFAVECDGHEFHERTKEAAQRDRARDRDLTTQGFTVVRFTGSEIHRDVMKCVLELRAMIAKRYDDWIDGAG